LLLYVGWLVAAFASGQRSRVQVALALAAIVASAAVGIAVAVTYPLRTEPVSAAWLIVPISLWPVLTGIAFVRFAESAP
jgi:hypothetical protein